MKNIFLPLFLTTSFLLVGCGSGMSDRTTAVKRAIETREYNVDTKALITASVGAFQDLGYTIDVLNSDYGLILSLIHSSSAASDVYKRQI